MAGTGTSPWRCWPTPAWRCWPTPAWRWSGARRSNQEVRGQGGLSQLGRKADTPDGARGPAVALPADMETSTYGRISAAVVPVETAAPGNGPPLPLPTPPETPHHISATVVLTTTTPPCWTTTASSPFASIAARAMKTASPSRDTTASRMPSTRRSSCGAAAISTPPTTTPTSSGRWSPGATAWQRGSWSRNYLRWDPYPQLPCRNTPTTRPRSVSGIPSRQPLGPTPCPPVSSGRRCGSGCIPIISKCTTRTAWWNAWRGCTVGGKPTSITATSSDPWCASRGLRSLSVPGAAVSHPALPPRL